MSKHGQATGDFRESSSALRVIKPVIRDSAEALLVDDGFSQLNPCVGLAANSPLIPTQQFGILSGSVAFSREDGVGGPGSAAIQDAIKADSLLAKCYNALGIFLNDAQGYAGKLENQPAVASGLAPYAMSGGVYGCRNYETRAIGTQGAFTAGDALTYTVGVELISSRNGFVQPKYVGAAANSTDLKALTAESYVKDADGSATVIGITVMTPDSSHNEIIWNQRI